ncbi:uncharacterized protein LOC144500837 [Mustelus asterias]
MENPIKIKRTAITLAQKVQIILKLNDPSFKQKEIAREYGLTASAISKIVKKKEEILEEWLRGGNLERKRKREGKNQTIDDALLSWFWTASKEEGPISGPVLMAKAKALAEEMGIEFKPTNGWLCRWKNRNNLAYKRTPKDKSEFRGTSDQWTGFPAFASPSLYLQGGQLVPDYYREGTATQPLDEAEEDSHDKSAEGAEQEEHDPQFYTELSSPRKSQIQSVIIVELLGFSASIALVLLSVEQVVMPPLTMRTSPSDGGQGKELSDSYVGKSQSKGVLSPAGIFFNNRRRLFSPTRLAPKRSPGFLSLLRWL